MIMLDGATLTGIAAITTSITGLIATLRASRNASASTTASAQDRPLQRRTHRQDRACSAGRQDRTL
ncbi:hypothetical protein CKY28_17375 [Sphingomonas lenta]|uniref:Uncharacterized protein n=1 Tax=Sphingomonas lenta TaxID=1141887 RepID=A0A2A2SAP4_9SPHN|nr:hypothetical protein CKY28_17375 [Sphingomonas lenta]